MQSNEEVNLLCALVLSLFFLSMWKWTRLVIFSFLKLLSVFVDTRTNMEATTDTWQIQSVLNSLNCGQQHPGS